MENSLLKPCLALLLLLAFIGTPLMAKEEDAEEEEKTPEQEELEKKEALEKRLAAEQEIKAQFKYTFNDISKKLVTVTCDSSLGRSFGSGFVAILDGKTYLFTNQHVIIGSDQISFKTAYGDTLRPRSVELSTTRDIARLLLADGTEGFEITRQTYIDAPVGVFGNSEGGGVATELYGKVTGISSEVIDVSADIVSGNSGSPVLNLEQQAIGIASYVQWSNDDKDGSKTRHFCYRLTDNQWKSVNWKKYNGKYGTLYRENEQLINSIIEVFEIWYDDPFLRMTADKHPEAALRKWSTDHNHVINRIMRLSDKGRCSQHELDNTNKRIQQDLVDSADALAAVCRGRSRQMRMLSTQRELTGFLREEFEGLADRLDYAAIRIDRYGKNLVNINYFHFE